MRKRRKSSKSNAVVFDRKFFAEARRRAWKKATVAEKKNAASHASRAYWDSMNKEQRSAEMKRRAKVRAKKKRAD
jgi:hypothetical protein